MGGLWRKNQKMSEGKYPIVLRRDGTPLESRFLVITLRDPCAPAAFRAYADEAEKNGLDPKFASDVRRLADEAEKERERVGAGDPDAPRHRKDDPAVLAWARDVGCPGG